MSKKNKERRKTTSCGALAWRLRDGELEVLLIKQFAHKDSWGIPKGHMHPGESVEECALREVREETGVEVVLGRRLPDCGTSFRDEDKTVISFLATPVNAEAEPASDDPDSEVADAKWISVNSLPRIHVYQQSLVEVAVEILREREAFKEFFNGSADS